jgi:SAM-dependent methyltransferase
MIATATATVGTVAKEWFASWFDSEHYHRLYAHRDDREAFSFIDRVIARLQPAAGADVLDLGCGSGRHARRLASHGFRVTGLDLSAESLALARMRSSAGPGSGSGSGSESRAALRFVRQDMRQPFGDESFDHVFSLFTSFGYFEDPGDHLTVIRNMAASLRAGGGLVLDYLNVRHAERHLVADETVARDGAMYRIKRWSDTEAIYKRIAIDAFNGRGMPAPALPLAPAPLVHVERVAKLTLEDFRFLFALSGLRIEDIYGDYQLTPFDAESSPRLIVFARKAAGEVLPDAADRLGRHAQV